MIEQRIAELGLVLPVPPKPVASYIPAVRSGSLLWLSGQIPLREGSLIARGTVPDEVSEEVAAECCRQCVLNGLANAQAALGSLDRITRVVRVGCWIACRPGFARQPHVANAASDLLVQIFGESGRHARAAVGSVALPLGAPVEIEFLFEVRD